MQRVNPKSDRMSSRKMNPARDAAEQIQMDGSIEKRVKLSFTIINIPCIHRKALKNERPYLAHT